MRCCLKTRDQESYSFSRRLFEDIQAYIDDAYVDEHDEDFYDAFEIEADEPLNGKRNSISAPMVSHDEETMSPAQEKSLRDYLKQMDRSFQEMLFDLIDESGMTDVECYKKANVDKRIFSKIKSNTHYRPSKTTALAFAISLRLDMDATQELLATAGYTLSRSNVSDTIIRYFIHNGNYDVFEINQALFEFDQTLLGSL